MRLKDAYFDKRINDPEYNFFGYIWLEPDVLLKNLLLSGFFNFMEIEDKRKTLELIV